MAMGDKKSNGESEAVSHIEAPDLGIPPEACLIERELEPCILVIFGVSGDLSTRKLMPALYDLHERGALPRPFLILGCSRKTWNRESFQNKMREHIEVEGEVETSLWETFAASLYFQSLDYDDLESYKALAVTLKKLDRESKTGGNRIFYLALPPELYRVVGEMLAEAGFAVEKTGGQGWSRMVVEKPFGRDLETARSLNEGLLKGFGEHQIFRIDHYLAKETVQNILILRFANAIFEPIWNRAYVRRVGIIAAETLGVGRRAGYYEASGVLRDMFQNHLMQLLALTAMEPPSLFEADVVRDEKVKAYRSLKALREDHPEESLVLGQYGPGVIDGRRATGYREEEGVAPDSLTPTFAVMRLFVDNWRWRGVPFYMVSGKRMARKLTQIVIQFRRVPHSMFRNIFGERIMANRLILGIQPDERVTLTFQTKNPGAQVCLRSVVMDFNYYMNYSGPKLEAYEKVLLDCIQGDQMLFWRQDAVELSWAFLTPILEECEGCADRRKRLHLYEAGSWGPDAARRWMRLILDERSHHSG